MLHDAARKGDVEIPVFCYEPKLGAPVGACRMCLVEIEGIPKLQTSCSTPVRDGMVVHTRTDQVKKAQNAVVEFLLVNHPLDCPVCDKGGECPLQDITQGWGPGKSRVIDEKRHFEKPVELSPLVAIDRERCILCYRCVRFSQEVSEDAQLQLLDRGDRTYVGTFDDRPYVSPFQGNITDLCPVGALTNYTYRFRARPWDIEQAGSVCTLCPSQCNVSFTVRDEKVKRVIVRDNPGVDDGWICDQRALRLRDVRRRGAGHRAARPKAATRSPTRTAIAKAAEGLGARDGKVAAIVGDASNEEGFLVQEILRGALHSPHIDSRPAAGPAIDTILDLARPGAAGERHRHRRGRRDPGARHRPDAVLADPRPADPQGDPPQRRAAGGGDRAADGARRRRRGDRPLRAGPGRLLRRRADRGGRRRRRQRRDAAGREPARRGQGRRRLGRADRRHGRRSCSASRPTPLSVAATEGAGLLEIPDTTNARGLREAGVLPDAGPGLAALAINGHGTEEIREALIDGSLDGVILVGVDPLRDFADTARWEEALNAAGFVVAFSTFATATAAKADVLFPLETHAEKDGTVTHPDGRLQRVRPAAGRPGDIRPGWQTLSEPVPGPRPRHRRHLPAHRLRRPHRRGPLLRLDHRQRHRRPRHPLAGDRQRLELPGGGTLQQPTEPDRDPSRRRRPDRRRVQRARLTRRTLSAKARPASQCRGPAPRLRPRPRHLPRPLGRPDHRAEPAAEVPQAFPAPRALPRGRRAPRARHGDKVRVTQGDKSLEATVAIRERVPEGVCFLAEGVAAANANALLNGHQVRVEIEKLAEVPA